MKPTVFKLLNYNRPCSITIILLNFIYKWYYSRYYCISGWTAQYYRNIHALFLVFTAQKLKITGKTINDFWAKVSTREILFCTYGIIGTQTVCNLILNKFNLFTLQLENYYGRNWHESKTVFEYYYGIPHQQKLPGRATAAGVDLDLGAPTQRIHWLENMYCGRR